MVKCVFCHTIYQRLMKKKFLLASLVAVLFAFSADAQGFVNKLKQKAEEAASKALEDKAKEKAGIEEDTTAPTTGDQQSGTSAQSRNRPSNKGGGGLVSTPPDVKQNLTDAET